MNPETLAILIPLLAITLVFLIPIIAIVTTHQRKMAELKAPQHDEALLAEVARLRQELASVKELVHEQTIYLDDQRRLSPPPIPAELEDRLTQS